MTLNAAPEIKDVLKEPATIKKRTKEKVIKHVVVVVCVSSEEVKKVKTRFVAGEKRLHHPIAEYNILIVNNTSVSFAHRWLKKKSKSIFLLQNLFH